MNFKADGEIVKDEKNNKDYFDDNVSNDKNDVNNSSSDDEDYTPIPFEVETVKPKKKDNRKNRNRPNRIQKKKGEPSSLKFICDICNKKFFKLYRLKGHLRTHVGLKVGILIFLFSYLLDYNGALL